MFYDTILPSCRACRNLCNLSRCSSINRRSGWRCIVPSFVVGTADPSRRSSPTKLTADRSTGARITKYTGTVISHGNRVINSAYTICKTNIRSNSFFYIFILVFVIIVRRIGYRIFFIPPTIPRSQHDSLHNRHQYIITFIGRCKAVMLLMCTFCSK